MLRTRELLARILELSPPPLEAVQILLRKLDHSGLEAHTGVHFGLHNARRQKDSGLYGRQRSSHRRTLPEPDKIDGQKNGNQQRELCQPENKRRCV